MRQEKIHLIVKTYPAKSRKYGNLICSAGLTDKGEWVRIYPWPFDSIVEKPVKKFSQIDARIIKNNEKLNRLESFRFEDDFVIVDDKLTNTRLKDSWKNRNDLLMPVLDYSLEMLMKTKDTDTPRSLGFIKPKIIDKYSINLVVDKAKAAEKELIDAMYQTSLDGESKLPIFRLTHRIAFQFHCFGETCSGHDMMIEDWGIIELWRKMYVKGGDAHARIKVGEKLDWLINQRELYLFVGTESRWGSWLIIGFYYPPKGITNSIVIPSFDMEGRPIIPKKTKYDDLNDFF